MTEVYPLSCLPCRRLKIKCNKVKNCNQCKRRNIVCEYPTTYRNSVVYAHRRYPSEESLDPPRSPSLEHLRTEVLALREYQKRILSENLELERENKQLRGKLIKGKATKIATDNIHQSGGGITIAGETSEAGEKYYGPQSSSFMIEKLKHFTLSEEGPESAPKSPSTTGELVRGEFNKSNQLVEEAMERDRNPNSSLAYHTSQNDDLIESSITKKKLPYILPYPDDFENNYKLLYSLTEVFFQQNAHYQTFICKLSVIEFLDSYKLMKENEWEHDDDLLLLYMILLLLIQRLTPREFVQAGLLDVGMNISYSKQLKHITKKVLFYQFEKLRHNLINESIGTIATYILCTEWYLIEQRYEECWSMMFHTCSIAYAIGLHATRRLRLQMVGSHVRRKSIQDMNQETSLEDEEEMDVLRFKVWFALKDISGQICSILGRPNPILIRVNSAIIQSATENEFSGMDITERNTQILLKIGLSECLRLSNMMLIENFMIDFTVFDLVTLDSRFNTEIMYLEWFLEDPKRIKSDIQRRGSDADFPETPDSTNLLIDLITLYINRAKFFEPFVNKFTEESEAQKISKILRYSILKFLDYTLLLIDNFFEKFPDKYSEFVVNSNEYVKSQQDENGPGQLRFGKLFRIYYPFLSLFVYQGIVVIFTFLHYKFKDFVNNYNEPPQVDDNEPNQALNYNEFLGCIEEKLKALLSFGKQNREHIRLWSSNIVVIIEKIIQHIEVIYDKQRSKVNKDSAKFDQEMTDFHTNLNGRKVEDYFGFNISDPFWLKNPENLPYYLSSPSDNSSIQNEPDLMAPKPFLEKKTMASQIDPTTLLQVRSVNPQSDINYPSNNQSEQLIQNPHPVQFPHQISMQSYSFQQQYNNTTAFPQEFLYQLDSSQQQLNMQNATMSNSQLYQTPSFLQQSFPNMQQQSIQQQHVQPHQQQQHQQQHLIQLQPIQQQLLHYQQQMHPVMPRQVQQPLLQQHQHIAHNAHQQHNMQPMQIGSHQNQLGGQHQIQSGLQNFQGIPIQTQSQQPHYHNQMQQPMQQQMQHIQPIQHVQVQVQVLLSKSPVLQQQNTDHLLPRN